MSPVDAVVVRPTPYMLQCSKIEYPAPSKHIDCQNWCPVQTGSQEPETFVKDAHCASTSIPWSGIFAPQNCTERDAVATRATHRSPPEIDDTRAINNRAGVPLFGAQA